MQGKETRSHPFMLYWNCTRKFFSFHLSNLRAKRLWQLPIYFIFPCRVYFQSFLYFHNKSDLPILPDTSSEACISFIQLFLWQCIYKKEWRQQKNSEKKKIEIHLPYLCEQRQRENARRNYFQESVLCSIFKSNI